MEKAKTDVLEIAKMRLPTFSALMMFMYTDTLPLELTGPGCMDVSVDGSSKDFRLRTSCNIMDSVCLRLVNWVCIMTSCVMNLAADSCQICVQ